MNGPEAANSVDQNPSIAESLQALRRNAGEVTYAEIAARIARLRAERSGEPEFEVSRSTVYDAFRPGRRRLNAELVVDIVLSLGVSADEAEKWRQRCLTTRPASPRPAPRVKSDSLSAHGGPSTPPAQTPIRSRWAPRQRFMILSTMILAATALNLFGGQLVLWLDLPLYLDMIGTAVISIAVGPWAAVATAVITQFTGAALHQSAAGLPFTPVAVVGALIWGYGVHMWGLARTLPRFLLLSLIVAVACSVVAVPITAAVFDGFSDHIAANTMTARFNAMGESLLLAVTSSNLITSVLDKLIASFIGLALGTALRTKLAPEADSSSTAVIQQTRWLSYSTGRSSGRFSGMVLSGRS